MVMMVHFMMKGIDMDKKTFWLDTETTGTDPQENGIIQIGGLIEINGEVRQMINLHIQPFKNDIVVKKATEIHGQSDYTGYLLPGRSLGILKMHLGKFIDKYNKHDKFIIAGYNVRFDVDFLRAFFLKNADVYFGSWFFSPYKDVLHGGVAEQILEGLRLPNYQLGTVCAHFGITMDTHDTISDIVATRELYYKIKPGLQTKEII